MRNTNIHQLMLTTAGTALLFRAFTVLRTLAILLFPSEIPRVISQSVVFQDVSMSWDGNC